MQKLVKCRIVLNAAQQRVVVDSALRSYGYVPVWIWRENIPTAYLLVSVNDDLYSSGDLDLDAYNTIIESCPEVEQLSCVLRDSELLDVAFNGPSSIIRTVNGNNTTVTQTTVINDGVGTWTYIFNITFDSSGSVISTSNSSSYVDPHTQSSTTVTTDPVTGETTQSTTTSTDGGYGNGGSTTTSTVTYDENGNATGSSSQTQNSDGTSSSSTQTYNENGTIAYDHDEFHNTDGSSESHTTNFDENGNPTDGENEWIDTSGNENTQTLEYNENGDPYITGYEIDTTNNPNGGENLTQPIDTGVLAFDGRDFDIHLKCKFYWSNIQYGSGTSTTKMNPILNLSGNDQNMIVNGFLIAFLSRGSGKGGNTWWNFSGTASTSSYATIMRVNKYVNDTATNVYHIQKSPGTGTKANTGIGAAENATGSDICVMDITCRSNVFHIGVTNDAGTLQTVCQQTNASPYTNQDLNFGNSEFNDVTVELGHWDSVVDNVQYSFNYEVLEFDIHKL